MDYLFLNVMYGNRGKNGNFFDVSEFVWEFVTAGDGWYYSCFFSRQTKPKADVQLGLDVPLIPTIASAIRRLHVNEG